MFQNVWNRWIWRAAGVRWAESSYLVSNPLEPEAGQIENGQVVVVVVGWQRRGELLPAGRMRANE